MERRLGQASISIDLDALVANWQHIGQLVRPAACAAVIKADGYGLGAVPVARALAAAGCTTFFVAHAGEALAVRAALPASEIFVLHGIPDLAAEPLAAAAAVPVLNSLAEIDAWAALGRGRGSLPAAIHIDTGMTRLGLDTRAVELLAASPNRLDGIELRLVMSHLACADDPSHPLNRQQRQEFERLRRLLPAAPASLANSGGILLGPEFHYDLVRPGIALYGGNPLAQGGSAMAEVVRFEGKILQVHDVDMPRTVGYGATHRLDGPARIATVAAGYADGYPRALSNRGVAAIAGVRVPVVGRVSMDMTSFDVSAADPELAVPGAAVDLIGGGVPLDEVAAAAGMLSYEILTRLGRRPSRIYRSR